jgi:DNA-binding IclR family transcriptional regulator
VKNAEGQDGQGMPGAAKAIRRAVDAPVEGTRSQTLHRGLALLEMVAETPLSLPELVRHSGLHRSVVYRLLRTLEDHHLVERGADDVYRGGLGLVGLARTLTEDLGAGAVAELTSLADDLGMTAFVVLRDGDEALTLFTVAPSKSTAHVTYRPGSRHPVDKGAPGLALLAGAPATVGERDEVALARAQGWIGTSGEVISGLAAVASPVPGLHPRGAAVCVVFAGEADVDAVGRRVAQAALAMRSLQG